MSGPQAGTATGEATSELRLAVTFTGGVSLAVWMGGMAREMNLLVAASRERWRDEPAPDTTELGREVRDKYAELLTLLKLDCSIDVLSGTSAGGINAAFLGLANVQRLDLAQLRELWFDQGSLSNLLRDPTDKQTPSSLLYGDKALLQGLSSALAELPGKWKNPDQGNDPTQVFITTTLLAGEASTFTDDYGTLVRDIDHRGLFSFTSEQLTGKNVPALALAARCSASFPIAFEPGLVPIGSDEGDAHPDMQSFTVLRATQFAADGGLLADRPLGPALQAVFDRPADRDVRRVLAFVVPMVGDSEPPTATPTLSNTPGLGSALRADLTAMLSQTISGDLARITEHNRQVDARNDARQQLAVLGAQIAHIQRLGEPFWASYLAKRASSIARAVSDEITRLAMVGLGAADGRQAEFGADSGQALEAARTAANQALPLHLPAPGNDDEMNKEMNKAGREALDDGRATVLAMLGHAFRLVPAAQRKELGDLRARATNAMPDRPDPSQADTVRRALKTVPQVSADPSTPAGASSTDTAVRALVSANMKVELGPWPWDELAAVVLGLRRLVPPRAARGAAPEDAADNDVATSRHHTANLDSDFVWDLLDYLTRPTAGAEASTVAPTGTVAARLFDLHVARYALQTEGVVADQKLELVQMSSDTRTCLDPRALAGDKLTGLQLNHFGAFYKASWRANDWMWGRLDGAGWLVHVLLDPRRLHQLAVEDPDFLERLRAGLEKVAGSPPPPDAVAEMELLTKGDTSQELPTSFPATAMWVAGGLQRLIAGEELANVAAQIGQDSLSGAEEGPAQAFVATYRNAASAPAGSFPPVPEDKAADVLKACKVSAEKLTSEVGTGLFAKTVIQAAAVSVKMVNIDNTANTANTGGKPHPFVRPVLAGARTVTSLAYRVAYVGPWAQKPAFAGLALIVLGAFASTSAISVLSAGGVFAVLAGLLLVAVSTRTIVPVLAILAFVAGAALAAAAYVPFLRDHLFPWLQKSVIPGFAKRPAEWAILVLFVLLPPLWTIPAIVRKMITTIIRRMRGSAAIVPTPPPTSSTPARATAEPEALADSA